jgi:hypothetical protein
MKNTSNKLCIENGSIHYISDTFFCSKSYDFADNEWNCVHFVLVLYFRCFGVDENIATTFLLQDGERRKTSSLAPYLPSLLSRSRNCLFSQDPTVHHSHDKSELSCTSYILTAANANSKYSGPVSHTSQMQFNAAYVSHVLMRCCGSIIILPSLGMAKVFETECNRC